MKDKIYIIRFWKEGRGCEENWRGRVSKLDGQVLIHFSGLASLHRVFKKILPRLTKKRASDKDE